MEVLNDKEKAIYKLSLASASLTEISRKYGITRERIHQIIEKAKRKMEAFEKYGVKDAEN